MTGARRIDRPYDRGVPGDLLDLIEDELFATDYRLPPRPRGAPVQRHLTLLPEPPTVRLRLVVDSPRMRLRLQPPGPDEATVRLPPQPVVAVPVGRYRRVPRALWSSGRSTGGWPTVLTRPRRGASYRARVRTAGVYRASVRRREADGTEVVVFVGLVVLIVVAVAASGAIVWWWA
jgi:hypothetical protein